MGVKREGKEVEGEEAEWIGQGIMGSCPHSMLMVFSPIEPALTNILSGWM